VRLEGLCQRKIPMTPTGIEPATLACSAVTQPTASTRTPFVGSPVSNFNACHVIGSDVRRPKVLLDTHIKSVYLYAQYYKLIRQHVSA